MLRIVCFRSVVCFNFFSNVFHFHFLPLFIIIMRLNYSFSHSMVLISIFPQSLFNSSLNRIEKPIGARVSIVCVSFILWIFYYIHCLFIDFWIHCLLLYEFKFVIFFQMCFGFFPLYCFVLFQRKFIEFLFLMLSICFCRLTGAITRINTNSKDTFQKDSFIGFSTFCSSFICSNCVNYA